MKEYQPLEIRLLHLNQTDIVCASDGGFFGGFVDVEDKESSSEVDMPTVGIF